METAMMQLKDKLLYEIKNLEEDAKTNLHTKGYRDAFVNLVNDIDAQMLDIERKSMFNFLKENCNNNYVAIAKSNYTSKDGTIKEGVLINGIYFAPIKDLPYK